MRLVPLDILSITLDIPFVPPLTQRAADLEAFAAWLCNGEMGIGLRTDQVRLKTWDDLYGYEMVAQFFGDNGLVTRTADRVKLVIRNSRNRADWELVSRILMRFYTNMQFPAKPMTTFSANVHSRLPAADELVSFFQGFPLPEMASRPALFSYLRVEGWETDVRVLIEKSKVLPDALFMIWETQFQNEQDWETFIAELPGMMERAVNRFGLAFMPMA